jgi:hypothetical protein
MVATRTLYIAFSLMVIINKSLQLRMRKYVWGQIIQFLYEKIL